MNTCECCGQVKPTPTLAPNEFWFYGYRTKLSVGLVLDVDGERVVHPLGVRPLANWSQFDKLPYELKLTIPLNPDRVLDTITEHQLHHG